MARYALVIGIAEYVSPSLPGLSKTTNDAEAVAQLLEKYGDFQSVQRLPQRWNKEKNGYEVVSAKVTGAKIGQELRTFLLEQATNNEALIYFSGHGFTIYDNLGQQTGYLASSDCQVELKENQIIEQKYGISLDSLNELIRDSQLSSLVMLLDCCHSGYFLERQLIERTLTAFSSQKDYYLITACRGFERAGAMKSQQYSIFTSAVIEGLADENAGSSGRISGDRLFDFVSQELKGSVQEPIRMGWGRSITLVTYPQIDISTENTVAFDQENPYRGLYAFEAEQAKYFCGREQAVRTLISRLADSRFVAVIGYSGSGKSSLVKAGLLPQLKSDRLPGSSQWEIASFTPGEHPLGKLVDILSRQQQQNQPYVLLIDQFEEIFTLCQDEAERQAFINLIVQEVNKNEVETRIIVTIRGDFLNRCAEYSDVVSLINSVPPTSFIVTPMSVSELEEAIEKPAKLHGVDFEAGLLSQIIADVLGQPGALPLLQYALKELWRICIEVPESPQPLLTRQGYQEIGGVKGALDKRATIFYQSLTPVDQEFTRHLFMELVQLGEAGEVTRRRISWEKLTAVADSPQQLQKVVGLLAGSQQRLIITDERTVEVAHEALLSEWKLLNSWVAENRENIRLSRALEEDCQEWRESFNKSDDALLTGAKLAVISEWVNKHQPRLIPEEAEFLRKSIERREQEIIAELEQEKKLREASEAKAKAESEKLHEAKAKIKAEKQRTWALVWLLCSFIAFGVILFKSQKSEVKQAKIGELTALTLVSKTFFDSQDQLSALLKTVEALDLMKEINLEDTIDIESSEKILLGARERNRLERHIKAVTSINFSPDGKKIVSASYDKTVKLWDINGKMLQNMQRHKSRVYSVKFSPKNNMIASAGADRKIILWDENGNYIRSLEKQKDAIYDIAFSPDGNFLASASRDKSIILWNAKNNIFNKQYISDHLIRRIDFAPDSKHIAFTDEKFVKIWNIETGRVTIMGEHSGLISSIKFSPKNNFLVSSDYDGEINIWNIARLDNLENQQPVKTFNTEHKDSLNNISVDAEGKRIASAGGDGLIKIWNFNGQLLDSIEAHKNAVEEVNFSPDKNSHLIVSASDDTTVKLWFIGKPNLPNKYNNKVDKLLLYNCDILQGYLKNGLFKQDDGTFLKVKKICQNYISS
ncbi:nSTAND1 domain-containing NTPase [Anabaena azotica]|uniref:Caspase family protein n=1 Tax=Anabaena azotica FACHB-119 TaxID=947527 RepID=A0ABR8D2R3_9NOST|nr:caspase family protein [Anabaena azotica]MBD2500048.1 caspase family protein [Anabaena azotica FACHB-119]